MRPESAELPAVVALDVGAGVDRRVVGSLLRGVPPDGLGARLDAGVREVRDRDRPVADFARAGRLPRLVEDGVNEVALVGSAALVEVLLSGQQVILPPVLEVLGKLNLAACDEQVALRAVEREAAARLGGDVRSLQKAVSRNEFPRRAGYRVREKAPA